MQADTTPLRAKVIAADQATGDIIVSLPGFSGGGGYSISKIGREAYGGLWAVPAVGSLIHVMFVDISSRELIWVGGGMRNLGVLSNYYTKTESDVRYSSSRRNLVDNGDFRVGQRGFGTVSIPANTSAIRTADRWVTTNIGTAVWDHAIVDVVSPNGLCRAMRFICTTAVASPAAGSYFLIEHRIEGINVRDLVMRSVTDLPPLYLTFDVFTNVGGTYVVELQQRTGAGGSVAQKYISQAVTVPASLWTTVRMPWPADASASMNFNNDMGLYMGFWLLSGSTFAGGSTLNTAWAAAPANNTRAVGQTNLAAAVNNNFHITDVQLEIGGFSSFERLDYPVAQTRCWRYFQRWQQPPLTGVVTTGTGTARLSMPLPVEMRAAPIVTISAAGVLNMYDGDTFRTISSIANQSSAKALEFDAAVNANWTVTGRAVKLYQAGSGYVDLSAEI